VLTLRSTTGSVRKRSGEDWEVPTVTDAEAVEQAAAKADRFNRMALRTLRALSDLRRYAPSVIVQNAGQVKIGQQQLNVHAENE
jgi:hypothetical protein